MTFDLVKQNVEKLTEIQLKDFSLMFLDALDKLKSLQVTGVEAFKECTRAYRCARDWKKHIETYRKSRIEPMRKEIANVNDRIKEFTEPLDQIEALAKIKVDEYNQIVKQEQAKEQETLINACKTLNVEVPVTLPVQSSLRGDGAVVYEKTAMRFEVEDLRQVPLRYLQLNEALVKQDLKLGLSEIPGLKIYEEKITQIRSR